ncbi:MAG: hypothetical protein KJ044_10115, partial [Planctomycetes bacterium]|nr:hypothetical protein [Planctomycetota bacterium]
FERVNVNLARLRLDQVCVVNVGLFGVRHKPCRGWPSTPGRLGPVSVQSEVAIGAIQAVCAGSDKALLWVP